MTRLRGDDDPRAALGDDLAEQFEHERRPVEIDGEDLLGRGLRRRESRGQDHAGDHAECSRLRDEYDDRRAGGDVTACASRT